MFQNCNNGYDLESIDRELLLKQHTKINMTEKVYNTVTIGIPGIERNGNLYLSLE